MAENPFSEFLSGVKQTAVKIFNSAGVELFTTGNPGNVKIKNTSEESVPVTLSGSNMKLYGASIDDRPAATAVSIGTTFTIVDETQNFKTWMSNGTNWGEEL